MSSQVAPNPTLSVFELVELFDDKPTVALVAAICEQTEPATTRRLLHVMYAVPEVGALPEGFAWRLTDEQARLARPGACVVAARTEACLMPTYVKREPLAEIIEEWIADHRAEHPHQGSSGWEGDAAYGALAFQTGVRARTLHRVVDGKAFTSKRKNGTRRAYVQQTVTEELADRILTGIGRPDFWHSRLAEHAVTATRSPALRQAA